MPWDSKTTPIAWHSITGEAALAHLDSPMQGLSSQEAERRLQEHGLNRLPQRQGPGLLRRLLGQFNNVLLYVMMVAAVITLLLRHWLDTGVILAAVLINVLIGFIQEGRAQTAMAAIAQMLSNQATVLRYGRRLTIDAQQLVPGDHVLLESGDRVPADLRLLHCKNLRIDESALTGESLAVDKGIHPVDADSALGDRYGMAYSGTLVVYGKGLGVVVATGQDTEIGHINRMLGQVQALSTPLLRQITGFGHWLAGAIITVAVATFFLGVWWRGQPADDMFVMVVALAASAIPEGLPAIITVTLALGMQRMAREKAIVRQLPAVESLGSVTVICSDKTGTLTRNEMTAQRVVAAERRYKVQGVGYSPEGSIHPEPPAEQLGASDNRLLLRIGRAAALCNDAQLYGSGDDWIMSGDPTEGALLALAMKTGKQAGLPRRDSIPFESENRFMATLHDHEEGSLILVKGAPERILEMCTREAGLDGDRPLDPDYWRRLALDSAAQGMRLLALAEKILPRQEQLELPDTSTGFTLLALVGIIDPPRAEAVAAVAECQGAGVRVKMITGDHVDTARAIGAQLGIGIDRPALTGAEIELLEDQALQDLVLDVDVFARASPEHKLRLVQALQARHQVVAMTGDGVNDAPALKRADIGVAMGNKGTEAAKEAADMVLADDNFATIGKAIREGRGIYDNIKKALGFMLPTNGGEALVVIVAILFALALPMTPAQVLWVNMVTASTLGLALAFEPGEPGLMKRPPRPASENLLTGYLAWRVLWVSLLMGTAAMGLFLWQLSLDVSLETARTMAINSLVFAEMFYLLSCRHISDSVINREGLTGNPLILLSMAAALLLQVLFTHWSLLQKLLGSTSLGLKQWLLCAAAGFLVFIAVELEKWVIRQRIKSRPRASAKDELT